MGFYLRKSLSFGPLRFNLSKSGIGVSAGVKGFRVGTSPRGNYVHAGRGGLYYRATLPGGNSRNRPVSPSPVPTPTPSPTSGPLAEIESGDALAMTDANSAALLAELNEKHKLARSWPIVLTLGLIALGIGLGTSLTAVIVTGFVLGLLAIPAAYWDARRKTTVLFYELESPVLPAVVNLHTAFDHLRACARTWLIEAEGRSADLKYSAGASTTVRRKSVHLVINPPPYFKTNVPILCIPAGQQRLFLLPDRLLVYDSRGIGAVAYDQLQLSATQTRFVESEGVPGDARVVDRTWRYVNKSGGPDRRFRDNPELPIALYEELSLRSSSGLNEKFQVSRIGASASFIAAVQQLALALRQTPTITPPAFETDTAIMPPGVSEDVQIPPPISVIERQPAFVERRPANVDRKYFYFGASVQGPFSREELNELHRNGTITPETHVCSDDDNRWTPSNQFFAERI
jgi:hypothetical protein